MLSDGPGIERTVRVPFESGELEGTLGVPPSVVGVVLFAHGSGSSRFSSRNRYVAAVLREAGLATFLLDLLTPDEEAVDDVTRHHRFDIPMLATRLVAAIDWLAREPETAALDVGLFGASTGGGAALIAAAERPARVKAVVSRGGRPDLAGEALTRVLAATLLIVGARDQQVIELNKAAQSKMNGEVALSIVPHATHLFEEPGALEAVAGFARDWFIDHLATASSAR
jgi:putative phosphoribosyl transferase